MSWRISNSMEAVFCVDCLEDALRVHGKPEVFNSDQGSQFTSESFCGVLKQAGITTAKAARGRAFDNIFVQRLWRSVKHEDIYLKGYSAMGELLTGLTQYFAFYNGQRMHQWLGNKTPDAVYAGASGGGALIVDKYPHEQGTLPVPLRSTGSFPCSEIESEAKSKPGQRRLAAVEIECNLN